jgi:hypothetical protein
MGSDETLRIDPRFRGPPDSGNGGYVAGELAERLGLEAAVRLHAPPPLDTPLALVREGDVVELRDGDALVARATRTSVGLDAPAPVGFDEAAAAARRFRGFDDHVFPGCFVCGPERGDGDGLRIFPGALEGRDAVAAPWRPDASLAGRDGRVAPPFVWAALDCPGCFAFPQPEGAAVVLGEISARLSGRVRVGERCVLVGWPIAHGGRKHTTGTALFGEDGALRGLARAVWIEVPRPER